MRGRRLTIATGLTGRAHGGAREGGLCMAAIMLAIACTPAQAQQALPIRGAQAPDPRSIGVDPRFLEPVNPFQPAPLAPSPGAAPALPDASASPNGGGTTPRAPSRASRPVRVPVTGGAQRRVRAEPPQIVGLPAPEPAPPGLRGTNSTRILDPAPNGLADAPSRRPPRAALDPWEPLGLRLGTFIVSPSITQSLGYDSNPNRAPGGARGSAVSRTEGELAIRSDWLNHSFTSNLRAGYSYFPDQQDASRPDASGLANLRLNVSRDTDIDFDARLSLDTQRPGSTNFAAATRERPNVYGYGASAGVTQRYNRLSLNLRGSVDRTTYDDARDALGSVIRQSDRDVTQLGVRGRVGYEVMPGFNPFVEVSADTREFDERADANGFRRGSVGLGARIGSTYEITRLLTGEASIGVQQRSYDDPRLKELRGVVGDAALIWSATPLTTVTLRAATDLADTTLPGVSGAINRRLSLELAHALRRNWSVTGFANAQRSSFDGTGLVEDTYQLGLRTEYRLTRTTAIRASFTHERLASTTPGADYTANIVLVGLRLQL